ncbi:TMEM175 family protein [Enterococcus casseliflavus]|uniref:TMEM175 family protein n=1 Tax=Enterococcus casseliflavus TaxID=37734 RepID=UPI0039FBA2A4
MSKNRIEAFTDAVIAIVMTLLVLELHQPEGDTFASFLGVEQQFIIYLISFVMLAIYWNNHHHLFQVVSKIDGWTLWANHLLILALTLFSFVTSWVSRYPVALAPQLLYGAVILLTDFSYFLVGKSLVRANPDNQAIVELFRGYKKLYFTLFINVLALLLGWLIHPLFIITLDSLVLLLWVIPEKKV